MLEKLHKQPLYVRRNITIVLTVLIFAIIFFLWQKTKETNTGYVVEQTNQNLAESPFSIAGNTIESFKDKLIQSIEQLGDTLNEP